MGSGGIAGVGILVCGLLVCGFWVVLESAEGSEARFFKPSFLRGAAALLEGVSLVSAEGDVCSDWALLDVFASACVLGSFSRAGFSRSESFGRFLELFSVSES